MKPAQVSLTNVFLFLFMLGGIGIFSGCSSKEDKEKAALEAENEHWRNALEDKGTAATLDVRVKALQDSIRRYEDMAFKSEELKVNSTLLLIEEVEKGFAKYDQGAINQIKRLQAESKASMYDKTSMANESFMEGYDAKVDAMVAAVKLFREQNQEFERHARAKLIYDDIISSYNQDLFIRNNYNIAVSSFNKLLQAQGAEIKKLGDSFRTLKPYPFFWGKDPVVPES